ncbi:hypothetical protein RISK_005285 [Rhodopirellula islandica]|uniref:Uncharacterized protein n=2 Tax=Rhodopirellula islandica TaxID=595434 RepID=A0A0J1E9T2_RHOIS|nr:hypothetical protein RISK_005285 [Rhodopirellula islandica]
MAGTRTMVNQQRKEKAMTQTNNNQPASTVRTGALKGVIWKNAGKDGKPDRYSVNYVRAYKTAEGQWKDTSSFSEVDNLKLGYLIPKVNDRIAELKASDREQEQSNDAEEEGQ